MLSGHDFLPNVEADENRPRRYGVEWMLYMVIDGRFGLGPRNRRVIFSKR